MIGILAWTAGDAERIRRAAGGYVRIVNDKNELRACCDRLDCIIVGCRGGSLSRRTQLLSELEQELPLIPVILVTDRETATLSRFLGALVMLRAHQLRLSGASWENVARQLGFARATLTRKCRRWPGCTLRQLELVAPNLLLAAFVAEYVQPLLAGTDREPVRRPAGSDRAPTD
ncbi:hypothetical protein [Candidatus Palauibacter sp.]|uniref:hypothetical protein n=1 Tax=Candidatus Palauibacter sp. TaxID=3101350 RepID=UPI003B52F983